MKKTHIFFGNQHVESFKCDGRKYSKFQIMLFKIKQSTKRVMLALGAFSVVSWSLVAGSYFFPRVDVVEAQVIKEVAMKAPIMDKIAQCESGNSHLDKKTGQVLLRGNTNKTVDIGKYQLNSVWHKKATELGYDITKEADNEAMAYWIFNNRGTGDWYASQKCWSNK
jgi:hypothetical protein